jgi:hypothetical protein
VSPDNAKAIEELRKIKEYIFDSLRNAKIPNNSITAVYARSVAAIIDGRVSELSK